MLRGTFSGLALLALALGACQGAPAPRRETSPDLASQADAALEQGDYERAADLYGQALQAAPESVPLRYGLAVAASHLGRRDQVIREFRWVLERGTPGSPEVEAARGWLIRVGALPRTTPAQGAREDGRQPGHGSIEGHAAIGGPGQVSRPAPHIMLILVGQPNSPTKEERYNLRTDEEGRFKFRNVAPGPYMLTDQVAGPPTWRLRIEVQAGQEMQLDLTPANSARVRDDFPSRG